MSKRPSFAARAVGVILGLISLFFLFYTVRLLWVTHGLTAVRSDGKGAYIGAVAFPLLAALFAYGARRMLNTKTETKSTEATHP